MPDTVNRNLQNTEPFLSIVIPAYNEAERIIPTIEAIQTHLSAATFFWELIIADDGSTDHTVALVQRLTMKNLRVLTTAVNGGKGSAVRRGIQAARGNYILFTDADNATPIESLDQLITKLTVEKFHIAVGSRAVCGASESNRSGLRHLMSRTLRWFVKHCFKITINDTQCGFKLFSRQAAQDLVDMQTIDGFSFDLELLYLAQKFGYLTAEVPVQWVDVPGSTVDPKKEVPRFLRDMLYIKWNDLRGVYDQTAGSSQRAVFTAGLLSLTPWFSSREAKS